MKLAQIDGSLGVPEIPIRLHSKPELGAHSQHAAETHGRIGRNSPLVLEYLVDTSNGHSEPTCELTLSQFERNEKLLS